MRCIIGRPDLKDQRKNLKLKRYIIVRIDISINENTKRKQKR